ncbi:MAG: hypothetical protein ACOQNY_02635 [Mycoplasmoidaceae bacterium]
MSQSSGTYFSLAKWFKWASLIVLLAPLTLFILYLVWFSGKEFDVTSGYKTVVWIAIGASIVWLILQVIMFCAAGTVRGKASPFTIRFWLFIALILVAAPEIMLVLPMFPELFDKIKGFAKWVEMLMPIIVMLGYAVGASIAGSVKRQLA